MIEIIQVTSPIQSAEADVAARLQHSCRCELDADLYGRACQQTETIASEAGKDTGQSNILTAIVVADEAQADSNFDSTPDVASTSLKIHRRISDVSARRVVFRLCQWLNLTDFGNH